MTDIANKESQDELPTRILSGRSKDFDHMMDVLARSSSIQKLNVCSTVNEHLENMEAEEDSAIGQHSNIETSNVEVLRIPPLASVSLSDVVLKYKFEAGYGKAMTIHLAR